VKRNLYCTDLVRLSLLYMFWTLHSMQNEVKNDTFISLYRLYGRRTAAANFWAHLSKFCTVRLCVHIFRGGCGWFSSCTFQARKSKGRDKLNLLVYFC
jgi:hypothetical protein